MTDD